MATVQSSTDIQKTTTEAAFVAFDNQICRAVDVINNTTHDIFVRRTVNGVNGVEFLVKAGSYKKVDGIENASQVFIKRASGNGSITVQATTYA
jgi:hypothetical protein